MIGELHSVQSIDVPASKLKWKCGGLVPNVAMDNMGLDGEELAGHVLGMLGVCFECL